VRVRLPGGGLSASALLALAAACDQYADGSLHLTSRGNLQLRGVGPASAEALAGVVQGAGLLPAPAHECVRNILASPLSGRRPASLASVDALTAELDDALCRRPHLAALPGRFLIAVDDGCGDVVGAGADIVLQARGGGLFAVLLCGLPTGLVVPEFEAVSLALAAAEAFLAERDAQGGTAWRLSELADGPGRVLTRLDPLPPGPAEPSAPGAEFMISQVMAPAVVAPGLTEQTDGRFAVVALTPLGLVTHEQALALAAAAQLSSAPQQGPHAPLRITHWRRVVLRDLELPAALAARELLDAAGLPVTHDTAWQRVTACTGRPGCATALADVQAAASAFVAMAAPGGPALHWAGCGRGCGTPSGPVAVAVAATGGFDLLDGDELSPREQTWIGQQEP
jgi:precorrin-3B synthase